MQCLWDINGKEQIRRQSDHDLSLSSSRVPLVGPSYRGKVSYKSYDEFYGKIKTNMQHGEKGVPLFLYRKMIFACYDSARLLPDVNQIVSQN